MSKLLPMAINCVHSCVRDLIQKILLKSKADLHSTSPSRIKEASPVRVIKRRRMPRRPHLSAVVQSNGQEQASAQMDSRYVQ